MDKSSALPQPYRMDVGAPVHGIDCPPSGVCLRGLGRVLEPDADHPQDRDGGSPSAQRTHPGHAPEIRTQRRRAKLQSRVVSELTAVVRTTARRLHHALCGLARPRLRCPRPLRWRKGNGQPYDHIDTIATRPSSKPFIRRHAETNALLDRLGL